MISRGGIVSLLAVSVMLGGVSVAASDPPPVGSSFYAVRPDLRLCPSPLCGGYWAALANHARTPCADGALRPRCYVTKVVGEDRHSLPSGVPAGALVRAEIEPWPFEGFGKLGVLVVADALAPAGRAPEAGSFYRLVDTGIRCVRAPCFSVRASRLNRSSRTTLSSTDLAAARAALHELARAEAALATKNGLLARGHVVPSPDGGRIFRATRLYLRSQS